MNQYLICTPDGVVSKDAVTKDDLKRSSDSYGDVWLINALKSTYYAPEYNEWMPIRSA